MEHRKLGRSGITVSALGFGTYGLSGLYWIRTKDGDIPASYGEVDDQESVRAIQRALEMGINFFDTADEYGCGHAESVLGEALQGKNDRAVIATKFGFRYNEQEKYCEGEVANPQYIRQACEASLRRLQREVIDVYIFHLRDYPMEKAGEVRDTLESLVSEGKIRWYGWSTDDLEQARFFAQGEHCTAVEHAMNIFMDNPKMLGLCEEYDLACINRVPFLSGVLTGKFNKGNPSPTGDRRSEWSFDDEKGRKMLGMVEKLQASFEASGRNLPQVALGWLWGRSERTIPIPGIRSVKQVEENVRALQRGALTPQEMEIVGKLLEDIGHVSPWVKYQK